MATNILRRPVCPLLAALALMATVLTNRAEAQYQYLTFHVAITYTAPYPDNLPMVVAVRSGPTCSFEDSSYQTIVNTTANTASYFSDTNVIAPIFITPSGTVSVPCLFTLEGHGQAAFINNFAYIPSSGQIVADLSVINGTDQPPSEIAYLLYVDSSSPGRYTYHFRANDALLALAQQTFGVNLTGVEFNFDVQDLKEGI